MADLDTTECAALAGHIIRAAPGKEYVLVLVDGEGQCQTLSSLPPRAGQALMAFLGISTPGEVDTAMVSL